MIIWSQLNASEQQQLLQRPTMNENQQIGQVVSDICAQVQQSGDQALLRYTEQFDGPVTGSLQLSQQAIDDAIASLPVALTEAIDQAYANIRAFHLAQVPKDVSQSPLPGVRCNLHFRPLNAVGLYIPGGTAPLPSTVLMLGVPSQIANNPVRYLCTPLNKQGQINPALLYAAKRCGIDTVFTLGGAQAIAAMAYGTATVPKVNKVFGPGNAYVTAAKRLLAQQLPGFAIDMPAGPSELLVIADERANPAFVAADLLSQAEHDVLSQVICLSPSKTLLEAVQVELQQQLASLPRQAIARQALANSRLILVDDLAQAVAVSNQYAPEHLSLQVADAESLLEQVDNAGSVFVGDYTPESAGDYASGTNHVLPTYGYAACYSSLGLSDFYRKFTSQTLSSDGLSALASCITTLAQAEGLSAHARAVTIRLSGE